MTNSDDPVQSASDVANVLLNLLTHPKPKEDEWQEKCGRLTARLSVHFVSEVDDEIALLLLATIQLAGNAGVKQAKKINPKLTRWHAMPPASVLMLEVLDLQLAALEALSPIRAPWVKRYLLDHLMHPAVKPDHVTLLMQWARQISPDWLGFVNDFCADVVTHKAGQSDVLLSVVKAADKWMWPANTDALSVEQGMISWTRALTKDMPSAESDSKDSIVLLTLAYTSLGHAVAAQPSLLFRPIFSQLYADLSQVSKSIKKKPHTSAANALAVLMDLIEDALQRYGHLALDQYRPMVPLWRNAFSNFENAVQSAALRHPTIQSLLQIESSNTSGAQDNYASEAAFATLISAWFSHLNELTDQDSMAMLHELLVKATRSIGIELLGQIGDSVVFDPLAHELRMLSTRPVGMVRIVRPGIQVNRADGSKRLLACALVDSVN
ncbi:hypothetical protein B9Z47_05505 [Limnohabitans sp. 2KL-1]|uniref:hypothetical protein n=1 Tax=Limnohabitans sp. 2KL-1 TaxID=1100699 RepID=UPI000D3BFDEC|nr:hypothetical protein [Limnohabitans sp. 2KL-1]PUE48972.1 hypothetical protein B9Z47_05505 [Limnohabitans sp. 2KL-1]